MQASNLSDTHSAVAEFISLVTHHKQLTWEMTKREIGDRYAGQVFGVLWAIGHPLIQMAVYVLIFAFVFKVRMPRSPDMPLDYTTYLLSGLIPWLAFMESMTKSTTAIMSNAKLVKQVVFPIEILPVKGCLASLFTLSIFEAALIIYMLVTNGGLSPMLLMLPVLMFLQLLCMMGVGYIFSAVGAYFRDLKDIVQVFCITGLYVMPIFYLPSMVPGVFRPVLYLNPFSYMVWCYQDCCYFGRFEHPYAWAVFGGGSLLCFYAGYRIFRKLKPFFGNIL